MESSLKRVIASRENGKKGGVKTEQGKRISSLNSFKHGILSRSMTGYDLVRAGELYSQLLSEYDVDSVSSAMLVEQLVICYVKLARCSRFEQELLNEAVHTVYDDDPVGDFCSGSSVSRDERAIVGEDLFKRMELVLTRYEPLLVKRMMKLLDELRKYRLGSFGEEE